MFSYIGSKALDHVFAAGEKEFTKGFNPEKYVQSYQATNGAVKYFDTTYREIEGQTQPLKQKYIELSPGIDLETGENLTLNESEYTEFLSVNKKLYDLFLPFHILLITIPIQLFNLQKV